MELIEAAHAILEENHPATVRQVFYQLVVRHTLPNSEKSYKAVIRTLKEGRKQSCIPWEWVEDPDRLPRTVPQWDGLADFAEDAVRSYRRSIRDAQHKYFELWLEKRALAGIFTDVLEPYGITLNVGKGYDSLSAIYTAAKRYDGKGEVEILYFGDFDPSGVDIDRSLGKRFSELFDCRLLIIRCAILPEDIEQFKLPPDSTKKTDKRRKGFVETYGDIAVELDALPLDILRGRIKAEVESRLDMRVLEAIRKRETEEKRWLREVLETE